MMKPEVWLVYRIEPGTASVLIWDGDIEAAFCRLKPVTALMPTDGTWYCEEVEH